MSDTELRLVREQLQRNADYAERASKTLKFVERRLEAKGRAEAYRTAIRMLGGRS